ncbi:MAG: hypothetical protein WD232_07780 [Acidimicrobiales bacterium]
MRLVHACLLRLDPTDSSAMPAARAVARAWASEPFGGWPAGTDARRGSHNDATSRRLSWRDLDGGDGRRLREIVLDEPHDRDLTLRWRTMVQVGAGAGEAFAFVQTGLRSITPVLSRPVSYDLRPPALIARIITRVVCTDAGRRLTAGPWAPARCEVAGLATLLTDPARRLPVVLVAADEEEQRDAVDAAADLVGLAHVVSLAADAAAELGRVCEAATPTPGTIRLCWPGWVPGGAGAQSWHPWELSPGGPDGHRTWAPARAIITASAFRLDVPPLATRLEGAEARRRIAALERQLAAGSVDAVPGDLLEAWEADLRALETTKMEAAELADELTRTSEGLHEVLVGWNTALDAAVERALAALPPREDPPLTMLEAIERAAQRCPRLVVLPEAHTSAARSPFKRPLDVYAALVALDGITERWQRDDLPGGLAAAATEAGLPWRADISDTAKQRYAADYTVVYDGQPVVLGPHLAFGANAPPDRHVRVHLHLDKDRRRIVVGYAGKHLRDATNR